MENADRADFSTRFESKGKGATKSETQAVGIRFSLKVLEALSTVPGGRQEYVRKTVKKALLRDGYLD